MHFWGHLSKSYHWQVTTYNTITALRKNTTVCNIYTFVVKFYGSHLIPVLYYLIIWFPYLLCMLFLFNVQFHIPGNIIMISHATSQTGSQSISLHGTSWWYYTHQSTHIIHYTTHTNCLHNAQSTTAILWYKNVIIDSLLPHDRS